MIDLSAGWFNILSGLCMAVFAPPWRCGAGARGDGAPARLAAILLAAAPVVYWSPFIAFFIGMMIYGF